jgi:hypothetical protein
MEGCRDWVQGQGQAGALRKGREGEWRNECWREIHPRQFCLR